MHIFLYRWLLVALTLLVGGSLTLSAKKKDKDREAGPLTGSTNSAKAHPSKPVPGAELFTNQMVRHFRIELSQAALDNLRKEARHDTTATVTVDGQVFKNVAVHLKGSAGSFRNVDDKPALTLNFDKFVPDQRFFGLRKIHLNNSVQDPALMTEYICGEMFRTVNIPAARVTHATVQLNDRKLGVYVLKEGFNKDFVGLFYKQKDGNLYDGGFCREITDKLERMCGSGPDDLSDVKALAQAAQEPDAIKRWQRLQQVLDVPRFVRYMALENMVWDWDCYMMNRNNYRIYFEPGSGKAVFIPHGMDQMFGEANAPYNAGINALVAKAVYNTPEGKALYDETYLPLFTNVYRLEVLTNLVAEIGGRVKAELAISNPNAAKEYANHINNVRDRIVSRANSLARQLNQPVPTGLKFIQGAAKLDRINWEAQEGGSAKLELLKNVDGKTALSVQANAESSASWRAKIQLEGGRYRFEGMVKGANITALKDDAGRGAGLRISGGKRVNMNGLEGSATWQKLGFEFDAGGSFTEVVLVCELRASKGQSWFDLDSLRLVKLK
ncbi:MAG: CotH kinase family protein [Verrucomicrobiota bacterium]